MTAFRKDTPERRPITTQVNDYSEHRNDLKNDFKNRCGYCDGIDTWRLMSFEIDHFIPQNKNKKPFLTIKTNTDYSNLVYACKSCNNSKSNKWPTNDENIPHQNDEGFIDPCDKEYEKQFERLAQGEIVAVTKLGSWIFKELKLHKPQHQIIWNIEQLDILIEEINALLPTITNKKITVQLKDRLLKVHEEYRSYTKQLGSLN
jgi:uncharacterized protein (TIGR02646 family)